MTKRRRQILSPVRSARDRVQRLRQRHLRLGQAARAVQICALQPDRLQARAGSSRAPGTARPSRTRTAIGGTPARRGSATIGRSSGGSTCSRPSSTRTGRCRASSRFGDFPHFMPTQEGRRHRQPVHRLDAAVVPQAGRPPRRPWASSPPTASTDEDPRTFWVAGDKQPGETLTLDLGAPKTVRAVQVNFADYKSGRFADAPDIYTEFELQHSLDGQSWQPLAQHRGAAPRPAQRLFRAAAAGAHALHPLRPRPCRRGESRDQRHARVRQCRRPRAVGVRRASSANATRTSATRRSAGRRCRARSATTSASASGPTG